MQNVIMIALMLNDKVGSMRLMFLKSNLYIITQVYFIKSQICNVPIFSQLLPLTSNSFLLIGLHPCYGALWQMLNTK